MSEEFNYYFSKTKTRKTAEWLSRDYVLNRHLVVIDPKTMLSGISDFSDEDAIPKALFEGRYNFDELPESIPTHARSGTGYDDEYEGSRFRITIDKRHIGVDGSISKEKLQKLLKSRNYFAEYCLAGESKANSWELSSPMTQVSQIRDIKFLANLMIEAMGKPTFSARDKSELMKSVDIYFKFNGEKARVNNSADRINLEFRAFRHNYHPAYDWLHHTTKDLENRWRRDGQKNHVGDSEAAMEAKIIKALKEYNQHNLIGAALPDFGEKTGFMRKLKSHVEEHVGVRITDMYGVTKVMAVKHLQEKIKQALAEGVSGPGQRAGRKRERQDT